MNLLRLHLACFIVVSGSLALAQDPGDDSRVYKNELTPIEDPKPLLADHPEFFEPIRERTHFEAPPLVVDDNADLSCAGVAILLQRAWHH